MRDPNFSRASNVLEMRTSVEVRVVDVGKGKREEGDDLDEDDGVSEGEGGGAPALIVTGEGGNPVSGLYLKIPSSPKYIRGSNTPRNTSMVVGPVVGERCVVRLAFVRRFTSSGVR